MINTETKFNNAKSWIDLLRDYPQAEIGNRGKLGNHEIGFCCLGAGCDILDINYFPRDGFDKDFQELVGLRRPHGNFPKNREYLGQTSLAKLNDFTDIGFSGIYEFLITHPDWVFINEVSTLLKKYYGSK